MLILVGVSVNIIVDSDLIGAVEKTGDAYKNAQNEESTMGLKINGITYQSFEDYLVGSPHDWQYTDNTLAEVKCTCTECTKENEEGKTFTIGQTVTYTDNGKGSSEITGAKSGVTQGIADGKLTASDYGTNGKQTINKDAETTWVVFGIEDTNGNGANETLLLTTANPTTETVTLYGAEAYKYGPEEIERICKEIYGSNARAMTIEDVNRTLGYTPTGGMYYLNNEWKTLTGFDTTFSSYVTAILGASWEEYEAAFDIYYTPDYPKGTTDSSKLENVKIDGYMYAIDTTVAAENGTGTPSVPETTATAVKTMVFGAENSSFYWLASRGVYANDAYAFFGPGAVDYGGAFSFIDSFISRGFTNSRPLPVRPIVSLTSNIPA